MTQIYLYVADLVAIGVLTFALYFPRHRRRDLLVAYLVVNIGVLAVTSALISSDATLGLGLGLFGVLSIIRLRSAELGQEEVAYYFAALTLGLLGGLGALSVEMTVVLMVTVVGILYLGDHPRLFPRHRRHTMVLDGAHLSEQELIAVLEGLLHATVRAVQVQKVDVVNDTTVVDVRFTQRRHTEPATEPATSTELVEPGAGLR